MKHDIVICTRNRPTDLNVALESIARQTRMPSTIIIVDASDDDAVEGLLQGAASGLPMSVKIERVVADPGLPAQRNLGARRSTADVIHFLDDDVVLEPRYLERLAAVFEHDTEHSVVGAGGLITNLTTESRISVWWRMALLDSKRRGVILPSGMNVIVTAADAPTVVQWLSGCSMSFRADVVRLLEFDESLPGYALMEDADFSFRASRRGTLVLEPAARLVHNVSPVERWDDAVLQRASIYRRGWFVAKNLPRWCLIPFWWSVVAGAAVQGATAVCRREPWRLRFAFWWVRGGLDFARGAR